MNKIKQLLELPRAVKGGVMVISDVILMPVALWAAIGIRMDIWHIPLDGHYWWIYLLPSLVSFPVFLKAGLYRSVVRYIEEKAIVTMLWAVTAAVLVFSVLVTAITAKLLPGGALFVYWLLACAYVCGSRFIARALIRSHMQNPMLLKRVIVYGAGSAGIQLINALRAGREYQPVALVDDEPNLHGLMLSGLKVYGPESLEFLRDELDAQHVLLALPSASRNRRIEIVNRLEPLRFDVKSLPGMVDLVEGQVTQTDIREVDVDELLGRDAVPPDMDLLNANNRGKVVLITGAGGSIGSELCRQVLACQPTSLLLYEISEYALYRIECDLRNRIKQLGLQVDLVPVLGSVRDSERLKSFMRRFHVQTVYHAAAYKHVPLVEFNVTEGILNNTLGTWSAADAARECQVETFVLISTDKAVRPTNVMGATKRMAELALQALAAEPGNVTKYSMVRFGNVLGSSGSVVPLFRRQIASGGPVTVTHPEIIRYFMTIPEAAQLVIQAGAIGGAGEVFVLDMGKPVKIIDLARRMIHLSGYTIKDSDNPDGDIAIQFSGLRPGEKLYEELLIGDDVTGTSHPRIMMAREGYVTLAEYNRVLGLLITACQLNDCASIIRLLGEYVSGFKPETEVRDHLSVG